MEANIKTKHVTQKLKKGNYPKEGLNLYIIQYRKHYGRNNFKKFFQKMNQDESYNEYRVNGYRR